MSAQVKYERAQSNYRDAQDEEARVYAKMREQYPAAGFTFLLSRREYKVAYDSMMEARKRLDEAYEALGGSSADLSS